MIIKTIIKTGYNCIQNFQVFFVFFLGGGGVNRWIFGRKFSFT